MTKRLPRPARSINSIKPPRHLVEIYLRLLSPPIENALQVDLVPTMLSQFFRSTNRQLNKLTRSSIGSIELVKSPLAFPSRLHQLRIQQQAQMSRNP